MTDVPENIPEVYAKKTERMRELVGSLKELLEAQVNAAEALDKKAWDILNVTSATFAIGTAVVSNKTNLQPAFWVAFAGVIVAYLFLVGEVWFTIQPIEWMYVPGATNDRDKFLETYVAPSDWRYLDELIIGYTGKTEKDATGKEKHEKGAIETAIDNNKKKAKHVRWAGFLLGMIVLGIVSMFFLSGFKP